MPGNGYSQTKTSEGATQKSRDYSKLKLCCLIVFVLICIFIAFMLIYLYWVWVMDDRYEKDIQLTVISEPLRDHITDTNVECYCSEGKSCNNWTCYYVREHFHRVPHECHYNDFYDEIKIIIEILLILGLCACVAGKSGG